MAATVRFALLVLGLAGLFGSGSALARALTEPERAALARRVESFDAAMRAGDAATIVDVLPPRLLATIGKKHGIDVDQVRRVTIDAIREGLKGVTFESFGMDLSAARDKELPDGTPYRLVPTSMVIKLGTRSVSSTSDTLAMLDGGNWYLLDLTKAPQVAIFVEAYPEFSGAELGATSTKAVP